MKSKKIIMIFILVICVIIVGVIIYKNYKGDDNKSSKEVYSISPNFADVLATKNGLKSQMTGIVSSDWSPVTMEDWDKGTWTCANYVSENVVVSGGEITLKIGPQCSPSKKCVNSGRVQSNNAWLGGVFSINATVPRGENIWPGIWMKTKGVWEQGGEIDMLEVADKNLNPSTHKLRDISGNYYTTIHCSGNDCLYAGCPAGKNVFNAKNIDWDKPHEWTLHWTPDYKDSNNPKDNMDFYVDGNKYASYTRKDDFSACKSPLEAQQLIFNVALGPMRGPPSQGVDPCVDAKNNDNMCTWGCNCDSCGLKDAIGKKMVVHNVRVWSNGGESKGSGTSSSSSACESVGEFCDYWGGASSSWGKAIDMLCTRSVSYCWDCTGNKPSDVFPTPCNKGSDACNDSNICQKVGELWGYLSDANTKLRSSITWFYNNKSDAKWKNISAISIVQPDMKNCNLSNVGIFAKQAVDALKAMDKEFGSRLADLGGISGCFEHTATYRPIIYKDPKYAPCKLAYKEGLKHGIKEKDANITLMACLNRINNASQ